MSRRNIMANLAHADYTIGWICALEDTELPAAAAMLEEEHPPLAQDPGDTNVYTLGAIAGHNIAIASLPAGRYGTNAAAVAAQNMRRTFTSLRFGLLVGIGGGVPSVGHDIRLGDIVVSQPTATHGGVIQHDLGKALPGGGFEVIGQLDSPPTALLNAVAGLKAVNKRRDADLTRHITQMLANNPKMRASCARPGPEHDVLYEYPDYAANQTPDPPSSQAKHRELRSSAEPEVYHGLVASGNRVIKDHNEVQKVRDSLRRTAEILCFEMEAAGLMNDFPCIVVRGISDIQE